MWNTKHSKFTTSRALRGDALIEALASTLVLGIVVIGVSQASRITVENQRTAIVRDLFTQQASNEVYSLTPDSYCQQDMGEMHQGDAGPQSTLVMDCNRTLTAEVNGKIMSDIPSAKTATLKLVDTSETVTFGLRAKED